MLLGVSVPEIKIDGYNILKVNRPNYIRIYLEDAIKKNKDMRGFESPRDLYLFEKEKKLNKRVKKL